MDFICCISFLGIIAVFGIGNTFACSDAAVGLCATLIDSYAGRNAKPEKVCKQVTEAKECLAYETRSCTEAQKVFINGLEKALNALENLCRNPDSIHLENSGSCDGEIIQECMGSQENKDHHDMAKACIAMGSVMTCYKDFKKVCKNQFMVEIVNSQKSIVDEAANTCKEKGYPLYGGDGDGGNGGLKLTSSVPVLLSLIFCILRRSV